MCKKIESRNVNQPNSLFPISVWPLALARNWKRVSQQFLPSWRLYLATSIWSPILKLTMFWVVVRSLLTAGLQAQKKWSRKFWFSKTSEKLSAAPQVVQSLQTLYSEGVEMPDGKKRHFAVCDIRGDWKWQADTSLFRSHKTWYG